jgi:hypothetical protein
MLADSLTDRHGGSNSGLRKTEEKVFLSFKEYRGLMQEMA